MLCLSVHLGIVTHVHREREIPEEISYSECTECDRQQSSSELTITVSNTSNSAVIFKSILSTFLISMMTEVRLEFPPLIIFIRKLTGCFLITMK